MNNLPNVLLIKLGDLSTRVWVITQPLHTFQNRGDKLLANVRRALLQVIRFYLLEVTQGGASDGYLHLLCTKYFLRLSQRDGIAFPDVSQS